MSSDVNPYDLAGVRRAAERRKQRGPLSAREILDLAEKWKWEPAPEPHPVKANHDAAPVRCAEEDPESQQCRDGMAPDGTGGTEPAASPRREKGWQKNRVVPAAPAPAAPPGHVTWSKYKSDEIARLESELEQVRRALEDSHCLICNMRRGPVGKGQGCACAVVSKAELEQVKAALAMAREFDAVRHAPDAQSTAIRRHANAPDAKPRPL